jgi:hypothetical protein
MVVIARFVVVLGLKTSCDNFNVPPQFYGFQPVEEVIAKGRRANPDPGNATGVNP